MPNYSLLVGLLLVLGSAFLGGVVAHKLKQPIIFGYLLAGLLVSGFARRFGLSSESLTILAEIGLAFLMFSLGLEFSRQKTGKLKKVAFGGGVSQIVLSSLWLLFSLRFWFNFDWRVSAVMALAFSLSSTAIVVKLLSEKGKLESLTGEIMIGWLLVQDLAVLPIIGLMPVLFNAGSLGSNLLGVAGAGLILAVVWLTAQKVVPRLTDVIAFSKSRELLLLFVVVLVLLLAMLTSSFGFSFGLGAFLAGLILSHTVSHFAVFSEIRPLRDVFLAVFFVSLGLSLEPTFLGEYWFLIVLLTLTILAVKTLLVGVLLLGFGYHAKTVISCGFGLAEVGEFSFVLAAIALANHYIGQEIYSLIISVALLTMVLTPWFFLLADRFYLLVSNLARRFPELHERFFVKFDRRQPAEELPFENHVVILGFGRVGKWVGGILDKAGIPYLVVEYNPEIIRSLKLEEKRVIFGDPTEIDVLDLAQVDKAKLVVLAIPDSLAQKMIMANCRVLNPGLTVICRSHVEEDLAELKDMGADQIIYPEFEAALSIGHRVLQNFDFKKEEINRAIKEVRKTYDQKKEKG